MVHYKLSYFIGRGKAEAIRQMLHHAKIPFEDNVFKTNEGFNKVKHEITPFGQMPVLDVTKDDGVHYRFAQSKAIARYLGRKHGMAGKNDEENATIDMYADLVDDLYSAMHDFIMVRLGWKDENKDACYDRVVTPMMDRGGPIFEKALTENAKNGWVVGDKITWVDFQVAEFFDRIEQFGRAGALNGYPNLKAHRDRVMGLDGVKQYMAGRPDSAF